MKFKVTKKAQRPARMDGTCFYCSQEIGDYHKDDCVLIVKRIKVRAHIEFEMNCPADWNRDNIEFHLNDSSWCASNALNLIKNWKNCICPYSEFDFIENISEAFLDE